MCTIFVHVFFSLIQKKITHCSLRYCNNICCIIIININKFLKKYIITAIYFFFSLVFGNIHSEDVDISKEINELHHIFRDHNLKKSISKSQYINLGLRLMKYPPSKGFILPKTLSSYGNGDVLITKMNSALLKASLAIVNISPEDRLAVVDSFHRDLGKRLLELESDRKWAYNHISQTMGHHSNVAILNDGRITPSNLSGSSQVTAIDTTIVGRKFPWGQPHLSTGIEFTNYAEIKLQDRNKLDFNLNFGSTFFMQNKTLDLFIDNNLGMYENNDSSRVGLRLISPGLKLTSFTNNPDPLVLSLINSKLSVGINIRDYSNIYAFDTDGANKDSTAFFIKYGFKWGKKSRFVSHNTKLDILSLLTQSDAQINDFIMIGAEVSHSFKFNMNTYKFTPKISIKQYSSLTYLTLPRDDLNMRLDLNLKKGYVGGKVELDLNLGIEDNQSDHPIFNYDNTEFLAGLSCNW